MALVRRHAAVAGFLPDRVVRAHDALVASSPGRFGFEHPRWQWPHLTPVLMSPGDAVVMLHSLPHVQSPNRSADDRVTVYFRVRRWRPDNPHESLTAAPWHGTDHPDRIYTHPHGPGTDLDYSASPGYKTRPAGPSRPDSR